MEVMSSDSAVLIYRITEDTGLTAILLVHCRGELAVMPAVTAVLLHHHALNKMIECSVICTGLGGNSSYAFSYRRTVTSQCFRKRDYCSVFSIGRGEILVISAVTADQLHHGAEDTGTNCNVVSSG